MLVTVSPISENGFVSQAEPPGGPARGLTLWPHLRSRKKEVPMAEHDPFDGGLENREGQEPRLAHAETGCEVVAASAWQAYNLDTLLLFLDA
jgi:hypothetical protein